MNPKKVIDPYATRVNIFLKSYDYVFSDFDPRGYTDRALSDDFLAESKRMTLENKRGQLQLHFLMPQKLRNVQTEIVIRKRLKNHYLRRYEILERKKRELIVQGVYFTIFGAVLMLAAALLIQHQEPRSILISFLTALLEPASWFLFWEGLRLIVFAPKERNPDLEYYERMHAAVFVFDSY